MRKSTIFLFTFWLLSIQGLAQTATEIISAVRKSQESIKTIAYKTVRHDTLVTGDIRTLTGHVQMRADTNDQVFGFLFWAKEDSIQSQLIFNGNRYYVTDEDQKVYSISTNRSAMKDLLYNPGGRIVVPDLVKLDISEAVHIMVSQDERFYYLTFIYPDLTKYEVIKRYKTVTIDKVNMLPVAVRRHQETLGKVQDLSWNIQQLNLNDRATYYDFNNPGFIKTYSLKTTRVEQAHPLTTLKGKQAPFFELKSFDDKLFSLQKMTGNVVLLDFWEVWCAPCIESMPKIQHLYDKFKDKGLLAFGVTNDLRQLESSKKLINRKSKIKFPMLIGNEALKNDYRINAVPQYVLIDRKGKIAFLGLGYSDELESEIESVLSDR